MQAVRLYLSTLEPGDREEAQQGISKFVRWWGRGGSLEGLTPPELGDYAEQVASLGTAEAQKQLEVLKSFLSFSKKKGMVNVNLAQHVKVKRPTAKKARFQGNQEAPPEAKLTSQGYSELQERLESLKREQLRVAQDIRLAAADKDVRENAPLEAAREELGRIVSQIREIEAVLQRAVVVGGAQENSSVQEEVKRQSRITEGTRVTIQDLGTGEELSYVLVDPNEVSPLENRISTLSPVGKALLNRGPGDEVQIAAPRGVVRYRVVNIG